jgi:hypothetical protein
MPVKRDWARIEELHAQGLSWKAVSHAIGGGETPKSLALAYARRCYKQRQRVGDQSPRATNRFSEEEVTDRQELVGLFSATDIMRITTLDDLILLFAVDRTKWQVKSYRINKWEQARSSGDDVKITPLYQVRAELVRSFDDQAEELGRIWDDITADTAKHAPQYHPPLRKALAEGEPCLLELAVMDPHIGMLAWSAETGGESYDSSLAVQDYGDAIRSLLEHAQLYPVEQILFVAGNDFLHVDGPGMGGQRGGSTTAGTPQDIDSRLAKMFTVARQALIAAVDQARTVAPVDVLFVPGNHDSQQTYRLAEVVAAWYRNDTDVRVIYGPGKRSYYGYGANALMFTHGEEYKRQRDNLPLIFATECPPELWVSAEHREIHTGHFHIKMEGRYTPTSDSTETRGIRTRALPGLTATDAWHATAGYQHRRTATALVFRRSGGIAGLHEFNP